MEKYKVILPIRDNLHWIKAMVEYRHWIVDNFPELVEAHIGASHWDWTGDVCLTTIHFTFKDPRVATLFKLRFAGC